MVKNYNKTLIACYLGFITQAITANFAPLLFLTFHTSYGISLGKIAFISTAFFFTQLWWIFFAQNLWIGSVTEKVLSHRKCCLH